MLKTLRNKIILLVCCVALTSSLLIGGLTYYRIVQITTTTAIEGLAGEARVTALKFKSAYDEMRYDAFIVSRTPPFTGLIRSMHNGDNDPLDGSSTTQWRSRLETIFISVMKNRPHYTQMRYIGMANNGRELVRVNRAQDDFERVHPKNLQGKAKEPYFKRGQTLKPDEHAFSEVTYNREFGEIDEVLTPTVRITIPIYDETENMFGMMVINADYEILLHNQFSKIAPKRHTYVVNHEGDYMEYFPGKGASPLELHYNYTKAPPAAVKHITETPRNEYAFEDHGNIDFFVRLNTDPNNKDAFLGVVLSADKQRLLAGAYKTRRDTFILSAVLFLAAIVGALVLAHWLTAPLQKMTSEVLAAEGEGTTLDLPVDRRDEIGELARAFDKLTIALVKSKETFRSAMEYSSIGMAMVAPDGKWLKANRAVCDILGYSEEVLQKMDFQEITHPDDLDNDFGLLQKVLKDEIKTYQIEKRYIHKNKNIVWALLSVSMVRDANNNPLYFILQIQDITDRKIAEDDRERLVQKLKISNEELDNFAYIASHDLKAPLRVIDNTSKWLEEDLEEHLDEDTRESMDLMRSRVRRMEKLLDDLLEYSRIGKKSDDRFKEELTAETLLNDTKELLSPPKGFVIEGSVNLKDIIVNRMPLQQVLMNLIGNAVKHHHEDKGRIEVSAEDHGEMYEFTVKDNGPGIPKEFHERIFKMFQTLKPRDQIEGSGMGLAMVQKSIETCGGKITVTSEEGKGSAFCFTWPK